MNRAIITITAAAATNHRGQPEASGPGEPRGRLPQRGFVLVGALLIMLLLVLIGISATTSTNLELQIATAERTHSETFYQADSGLEIASALVEENTSCPEGFGAPALTEDRWIGPIRVYNHGNTGFIPFWQNDIPTDADILAFLNNPTGAAAGSTAPEADFSLTDLYPWIYPDPGRGTHIRLGGRTETSPGAALQMAAGYVGLGKSAAAGGTSLLYDIYVQHRGLQNSEAALHIQWRHVVGREGPCRDNEL